MAELMALVAVWPKPQIEASTITWAMSSTSWRRSDVSDPFSWRTTIVSF